MPKSMVDLRNWIKGKYGAELPIEPSAIRVEQEITNSLNNYVFDILQGNGTTGITETKLDKNDVFFASHLGIYLLGVDTTKPGAAVLQTYPNEIVFGASGTATGIVGDLEAFYGGNSLLTIKLGTKEFISSLPTKVMRYVPQTQQSTLTNKSEVSAYDGVADIERFRFSGLDQIQIRLQIPPFVGITPQWAATAPNRKNAVVFMAHGFLVKGMAQAVSRLEPNMSGLNC